MGGIPDERTKIPHACSAAKIKKKKKKKEEEEESETSVGSKTRNVVEKELGVKLQ